MYIADFLRINMMNGTTKNVGLLALGVALAISASSIAQTPPGSGVSAASTSAASTSAASSSASSLSIRQAPATTTTTTTTTTARPASPLQPAGSLAPPAPAESQHMSSALAALQPQQHNQPSVMNNQPGGSVAPMRTVQAPFLVPAGPNDELPSVNGQSQDTTFRQIAKFQAQLTLLKAAAEVQKQDFEIRKNQLAFEKDVADAHTKDKDSKDSQPPASSSGSSSGSSAPPSSPLAQDASAKFAAMMASAAPQYTFSVSRTYGYGGHQYAEILVNGAKVLSTIGTVLPGGDRVVAITSADVTVIGKSGKRHSISFDAPTGILAPAALPSGTGSAASPQFSPPPIPPSFPVITQKGQNPSNP
jgi:type IV pilus biogenesis protein PilP